MMLARSSENADRIHEVFSWIINGISQHDIEKGIVERWPDAKVRPLIVDAMKRIASAADASTDAVHGWAIEATKSVYKRAMDTGDFATALRAIKQFMQLSEKCEK